MRAKLAAAALALTAAAAAVALLWRAQAPPPAGDDFPRTMAGHLVRLDAGSAPGRVLFLGSSTLQALDTAAVTPLALNLAIGGDTLQGLQERLASYRSPETALAFVVNIGFNDVMGQCQALTAERWAWLLRGLPADPPVVVLGLQGVTAAALAPRCSGRLPALLQASNEALAEACAARPGCRFVPNPVPARPLPEHATLQGADGLHLSPPGYAQLVRALREALPPALRAAQWGDVDTPQRIKP